jgi:hypothetical protein
MVGWTFAAIDQTSMTLLDRARATVRKASTPMGAHLDLIRNARQADKASGNKCIKHALSLFDFLR